LTLTCGVAIGLALMVTACGKSESAKAGAAESSAPAAAAAAAAAEPAAKPAADDAAKFAGGWMADSGQFTKYAYEDGKLYVLFGSDRSECTLADGQISYRASGMNVRMHYRFVDDDTIEYTDPSMPNWKMVQKRQS